MEVQALADEPPSLAVKANTPNARIPANIKPNGKRLLLIWPVSAKMVTLHIVEQELYSQHD
jgi:hypothetical protein